MTFEETTTPAHERRITRCIAQSCRARIIYLPTPRGANMPVDADTVEPDDVEYDAHRHMSHYKTCTEPNRFGKGKR